MGKSMARIQNGIVTNIEWVDDRTVETDTLKNIYGLRIRIGDTYSGRHFYRDGKRIPSFRERLQDTIIDYDNALTEIESAIQYTAPLTESSIALDDRRQKILVYLTNLLSILNEGGDE